MAAVEDTVPDEVAGAPVRRARTARALVVALALVLTVAAWLVIGSRAPQRAAGDGAQVARNAQGVIRMLPESSSPAPARVPLVDVSRLKLDETIRPPTGGFAAVRASEPVPKE